MAWGRFLAKNLPEIFRFLHETLDTEAKQKQKSNDTVEKPKPCQTRTRLENLRATGKDR